jgi:hypothetical protein
LQNQEAFAIATDATTSPPSSEKRKSKAAAASPDDTHPVPGIHVCHPSQQNDSLSSITDLSFNDVDNGKILIEGIMHFSKGRNFSARFVRLGEFAIEYFGLEDKERTMPRGRIRLVDIGKFARSEGSFTIEVQGRELKFRPANAETLQHWVSMINRAVGDLP